MAELRQRQGYGSMILRRLNRDAVTVHGFRSSFRGWAGNVSSFPREIVETALAHVIGDKAEQAYRRSDALEKRRKLMEAWVSYCKNGDIFSHCRQRR
jgi:integrase